ncbi:MAG: dihydroxyacetone kinase phosphoryl donor subunit DhaM [Lachnospiraceae bacterium]
MVGFVIISHSKKLAEGVVDLTRMMAPGARIAAAGGLDDGSFGTSFERIQKAIIEVYSQDGVILLMDMGSAVMTAEMVLEKMADLNIRMADCPIAEGAVVGTVQAVSGASMEEILEELATVGTTSKLS